LILLAALVPMVSPSNLRLVMLLSYPLVFFAIEGVSRLQSINWKRFKKPLFGVGTAYLIAITAVFSAGFLVMPPLAPFPYFVAGQFNSHIYQIPSSMLQKTPFQ
jgi:hypothetical protein